MQRNAFRLICAGSAMLIALFAAPAAGGEVTTVDVPGAVHTFGRAVNPEGEMAGWYIGAGTHGFVRGRDGAITTVDVPGAIVTQVLGNDPLGRLVGNYRAPDGKQHGFILRDAILTTIDYPGASRTVVRAISPTGDLVGFYNAAGVTRGYLRTKDGEFTTIDVAGSVFSQAFSINPKGEIVGPYMDVHNEVHGFLRSAKGDYTTLDVPFTGGHNTLAFGNNPPGDIVGCWDDATQNDRIRGFLLRNGLYTAIDVPGAVHTIPFGISSTGEIAGQYYDGNAWHGFLMTR